MQPMQTPSSQVAIALSALLAGCAASSGAPESTVIANVTVSEDTTSLDLVRLVDNGTSSPTAVSLGSWELDFGGLPFAIDQGSVPSWQTGVAPECLGSETLGAAFAGQCVFQPLVDEFSTALADYGIARDQVTVEISFQIPEDPDDGSGVPVYTQEKIAGADLALDTYASSIGFQGIEGEDAAADAANSLVAYWHDSHLSWSEKHWLQSVPGERRVSDLSVPGTHDSVARHWGDLAETQTLSILDQLNGGIRALDIRLKCRSGKLVGFHGDFDQSITFDDVLNQMANFLYANPGEAIFARIKNESEKDACEAGATFQQRFDWYFSSSYLSPYFWKRPQPTDADPTRGSNPMLQDVRGQIVVLQDFPRNGYGLFGLEYGSDFDIQDHYALAKREDLYWKWELVRNQLENAKTNATRPRKACLNFLSAAPDNWKHFVVFPYFVASGKMAHFTSSPQALAWKGDKGKAKYIYPDFPRNPKPNTVSIYYQGTNELTMQWLRNANPKVKYTGFVFADFPGPDLIREVFNANARYP
jgi:1-phosphatidylinositol phosphodiesterase